MKSENTAGEERLLQEELKEKEKLSDYFHKGLAAFLTVAMCILFFFILFRFNEIRKYAGLVVGILMPFIYGAVIAYLLTPVCNWLEKHMAETVKLEKMPASQANKCRRLFSGLSIFLSLLLFCSVIYGLVAMVVPQLITSVLTLVEALPGYIRRISAWAEKLVQDNPLLVNYVEQYSKDVLDYVNNFATRNILPNINNIISGVSTSLMTAVTAVKNFVIGLIVAVYLMSSRKMFCRQARMAVRAVFPPRAFPRPGKPEIADWLIAEANILNDYLGGFIKGKLLDSLIIGLICMAVTSVMEMPYAVLVSVVIGVTNIIPFFGPFIGAVPTAILILMVNPVKCVYFVVFILILQQFDGNILGPKILGNTTNLSTFWVLFAILLFGGLFGIPGMVVGVPVFAFFYRLAKDWVHDRLNEQRKKEGA